MTHNKNLTVEDILNNLDDVPSTNSLEVMDGGLLSDKPCPQTDTSITSSFLDTDLDLKTSKVKRTKENKITTLKIKIPETPRIFTLAEIDLVKSSPYGKKHLIGMRNPKRRDRQKFEELEIRLNLYLNIISLIEFNGGITKNGCELAKEQLGIVVGSNRQASQIIEVLQAAGLIKRIEKKHSFDEYKARCFKLTDKWKNCNVFSALNDKINETI